jgi:hypothetical protein
MANIDATISEHRPGVQRDFRLQNEGTIVILYPESPAGEQWATDNLGDGGQRWCHGYVIEHRFIEDILFGIHNDGLRVTL